MMQLLALALLASVLALTSGCGRTSGSSCICNLKQIDGAKATWALENGKKNSDIPTESDLFGLTNYIRDKPICPEGGIYTLGRVDDPPRCSIPEHDLYWFNHAEWGKVYVFSDSCAPIEDAIVQAVAEIDPDSPKKTDRNGLARIDARGATGILVSKPGYGTNSFLVPPVWPLRLVLLERTD